MLVLVLGVDSARPLSFDSTLLYSHIYDTNSTLYRAMARQEGVGHGRL